MPDRFSVPWDTGMTSSDFPIQFLMWLFYMCRQVFKNFSKRILQPCTATIVQAVVEIYNLQRLYSVGSTIQTVESRSIMATAMAAFIFIRLESKMALLQEPYKWGRTDLCEFICIRVHDVTLTLFILLARFILWQDSTKENNGWWDKSSAYTCISSLKDIYNIKVSCRTQLFCLTSANEVIQRINPLKWRCVNFLLRIVISSRYLELLQPSTMVSWAGPY